MQNKGLLIGIGVFVGAVLLVFLLLRGGYQAPTTQQVPAPGATGVEEMVVTPDAEETAGEVREITVSGSEYSFSPSSITVGEGERIRLTFKNTGNLPHNLTVEGLGIATRTISGGATNTVEFVVEESGTYTTFCSVGNHRSLGMEGELSVE